MSGFESPPVSMEHRSTPGSLDLSGSRFKQGQLTPSPPESPIDSNLEHDIRPPSCEEDIDFHRVTPPKLPKSNHSPFIGNTHNIARVEPLPPPLNTNSKFLSDDLDMLEELKARAKAALLKEGDTRNQESLLKAVSKDGSIDDTVELLKNSISNVKQKRRHESEEAREKKLLGNEKSGCEQELEDSENQP